MQKHTSSAMLATAVLAAWTGSRACGALAVQTYYATGSTQTFSVPPAVTSVVVHLWGAGGGGSYSSGNQSQYNTASNGGGGAFVSGKLAVTPGEVLGIVVGSAGTNANGGFGGGGSSTQNALGGGGRSAITLNGADVADAGGGGSGGALVPNAGYEFPGVAFDGGAAGINLGSNGAGQASGFGASSNAAGAGNYGGAAGTQYGGGNAALTAGGGGGGYFGGGGGGLENYDASGSLGDSKSATYLGGGGGGDSFVGSLSNPGSAAGSGTKPGANNNTYYQAGIGTGGIGNSPSNAYGGDGLVVVTFDIASTNWLPNGSGYLDDGANWSGGVAPNVIDSSAYLGPVTTSRQMVYTSANDIVGMIQFDSPFGYTLINGGDPNTYLNVQVSSGSAAFSSTNGTNNLRVDLYLSSNLNMTTTAGSQFTVVQRIGGPGTLNVSGGGSVVFLPMATVTVPIVNNGTILFNNSTGTGVRNVSIPSLTVGLDSSLQLQNTGPGNFSNRMVLQLNGLAFTSTTSGVIDLANNDMIVSTTPASIVQAAVAEGYNNGSWNSAAGIISSAATSDTTHLTALGVIENNHGTNGLFNASNLFDGIAPSLTSALVKYTYYGDANLSGNVDGSDYSLIDNGYLNHLSGWYNGDFNYDGVVDGSDYTLIDNAFNTQDAALDSQLVTTTAEIAMLNTRTVPEPACLAALGISAMLAMLRRRSKNENSLKFKNNLAKEV